MITHYGLFWSEKDVVWTGGANIEKGLFGKERLSLEKRRPPTKAEREAIKNFSEYRGLYCLYGEGELLYIGETGLTGRKAERTLFQRLGDHRKGGMANRWDRFSWFGREALDVKVDGGAAIQQMEAIAIAIINPGFNKQSGTFKDAKQVFQVAKSHAVGGMDTRLNRVENRLDEILAKLENMSK